MGDLRSPTCKFGGDVMGVGSGCCAWHRKTIVCDNANGLEGLVVVLGPKPQQPFPFPTLFRTRFPTRPKPLATPSPSGSRDNMAVLTGSVRNRRTTQRNQSKPNGYSFRFFNFAAKDLSIMAVPQKHGKPSRGRIKLKATHSP